MKKQYSILSVMFILTLSFFMTSCQKKDEALVTDFNAKKTEADKLIAQMGDDGKMMMSDHAAWTAKLDSAGKAGADMGKINGFKAQMKQMEDMGMKSGMSDSLKVYSDAKVDNNDQLKAAIAGLNSNLAACNSMCSQMMDMHKKLGADIMAFLAGGTTATAPMEEPATGKKTTTTTTTTTTVGNANGMDMSKHPVKTQTNGTPRKGGGSVIKQ